ncbi:hypothetical protein Tco_1186306 [Tanacetum coccineum]
MGVLHHGLKRLYKVGLTARVESSGDEESLGEDASKLEKINAIDVDEDITLVNDQDDADMFDGFAAVLAVLVTEASQSRQHSKSESDSYYLSD